MSVRTRRLGRLLQPGVPPGGGFAPCAVGLFAAKHRTHFAAPRFLISTAKAIHWSLSLSSCLRKVCPLSLSFVCRCRVLSPTSSTPTAWGLWCRPLPAQRSGQRCAALCLLRRGRGSVVDIKGCVALKSVCSVSLGCAVIGAYPGGGRGSHPPVGVRAGCASWGGRLQVVAPGRARAVHRGKRVRRARRERRRAQPRR
jgi:hypothetical protein